MAYTLVVDPNDETLAWFVFIDRRPVINFNRDFQASLNLNSGSHRVVVHAQGKGATVKVSIEGGAIMTNPAGAWPLIASVPSNKVGHSAPAEFSV